MCELEKLEVIKNINKIIGTGEKMEGNCLYKQNSKFELRKSTNCKNLRYNIQKIAENKKNILEVGFNAGHSTALMLNKNPGAKFTAMDIGRHIYTKKCIDYMSTIYNIKYLENFLSI